ncbi:MAG: PqqD family protein [Acidimicrobiales bacterium]
MSVPSPVSFDPADRDALAATVLERVEGRHDARIDDETVIYDVASGRVSSLNPTGTMLWEMLAEPRTLDELSAALKVRFGIDQARADSDVCAYATGLHDRNLIRIVSS